MDPRIASIEQKVNYFMRIEKPYALTSLSQELPGLFEVLKRSFVEEDTYVLNIASIESAPLSDFEQLKDLAAITLRKLQLLQHIATEAPTTDRIVMPLLSQILTAGRELHPRVPAADREICATALRAIMSAVTQIGGLVDGSGETVELF